MDEALYGSLKQRIASLLDAHGHLDDDRFLRLIEDEVWKDDRARSLNAREKGAVIRRLFHSFRGLDVLQPLLDDPAITEIMVNGHEDIFVEKEGEMFRTGLRFDSEERLEHIIQTIVGKVNRSVNTSSPIADARLPDGSRVHVVLPPVSLRGPIVTIRKFPPSPLSMDDLLERGTITPEAAEFLRRAVRARCNMFISGGTGAGKTTLLNALSQSIPEQERVITIEDSAELQMTNIPNLVRMETRNANAEGKGRISIRDLIRASLRMRPDRIIVGEVRGAEAADMLQAMNTGHAGSLCTGHGNSCRDMLHRLETMVLMDSAIPLYAVRQQIASAIDILVHLSRLRDRSRRVMEICELAGCTDEDYRLNPLFQFVETDGGDGQVRGRLERTGNGLRRPEKWRLAGIRPFPVEESLTFDEQEEEQVYETGR
jgi:pilus assembly protein CpaF